MGEEENERNNRIRNEARDRRDDLRAAATEAAGGKGCMVIIVGTLASAATALLYWIA